MIQLIFYKAKGRFFDKLIRWYTKEQYSHCEIYFNGNCMFSADAWENKTRFKQMAINPDSWDIVDIPVTSKEIAKIYDFCIQQEGKKYDWSGIASFMFPLAKPGFNRWFCSEICTAALQEIGKLLWVAPEDTTPGQLYKLLTGAKI